MKRLLIQMGICVGVFGFCLYSYLDLQNKVTKLKIQLPKLEEEIRLICEENQRLSYEIDHFESPAHLIELASQAEFRHLKHPYLREVLTVPEAFASN